MLRLMTSREVLEFDDNSVNETACTFTKLLLFESLDADGHLAIHVFTKSKANKYFATISLLLTAKKRIYGASQKTLCLFTSFFQPSF